MFPNMDIFWKKSEGEKVVVVIFDPKKFIADLGKLTHIYKFSQRKRNVISKNGEGGGGQRPFEIFPKKIQIGESVRPLSTKDNLSLKPGKGHLQTSSPQWHVDWRG